MNNSHKSLINIISALFLMLINLAINLFLTPYIIKNIGAEANGFISLASNFVTYATLITIAFNSMGGRHISVCFHRGDKENAKQYFNSLFFINVLINAVLVILATAFVFILERLINIPNEIVNDVKVLFFFILVNFGFSLLVEVFSVVAYVLNDLYIVSAIRSVSQILRVLVMVVLFANFQAKVYFVGASSVLATLFLLCFVCLYAVRHEVGSEVSIKHFRMEKIKLLIKSGFWNTVTSAGNVLSNGIDLLLANVLISPMAMGVLAIPKTLTTIASNFLVTFTGALQPLFIVNYAKGNNKLLVKSLIFNIKLNGMFASIIFAWVWVFSEAFLKLWVPSQNAHDVWVLLVLSMQSIFWTGGLDALYSVFSVTDKLKGNAILRLVLGVLAVLINILLLNWTTWGIYSIACVAQVLNILASLTHTPVFAAKYLGVSILTFFPSIVKNIMNTIFVIIFLQIMANYLKITGWGGVLVSMMVAVLIGVLCSIFILFDRQDRLRIKKTFARKKHGKD